MSVVSLLLFALSMGNFNTYSIGVNGQFFSITKSDQEKDEKNDNSGFIQTTGNDEKKEPVSAPTPKPYEGVDHFVPGPYQAAEVPKVPTPYSKGYKPYQPPPLSPNAKPTERPTPRPTLRPTPEPTPHPTKIYSPPQYNPFTGPIYPVPEAPVIHPSPDPTPQPTRNPTVSVVGRKLVSLIACP